MLTFNFDRWLFFFCQISSTSLVVVCMCDRDLFVCCVRSESNSRKNKTKKTTRERKKSNLKRKKKWRMLIMSYATCCGNHYSRMIWRRQRLLTSFRSDFLFPFFSSPSFFLIISRISEQVASWSIIMSSLCEIEISCHGQQSAIWLLLSNNNLIVIICSHLAVNDKTNHNSVSAWSAKKTLRGWDSYDDEGAARTLSGQSLV